MIVVYFMLMHPALRPPSPPTGLKVSVDEETAAANITWNPTETHLLYTVHVVNFTDTFKYESFTTVSVINTTQEYLEYNLSLFDSCNLSSVRFSVSVVVNSTPCPESRKSEMKGFSDVMSAMGICEGIITNIFLGTIMAGSCVSLISLHRAHQCPQLCSQT